MLTQTHHVMKLSAVRKVLETRLFLALGIIETLGSIISLGTSQKFADVRTHLRKVFKMTLNSIWIASSSLLLLIQIKNDLVIIEINGIGLDIDSKVIINFR